MDALARTAGPLPAPWQTGGWRARARSAALLYGAGSVLAAATLLAPSSAPSDRKAILVLCAIAAAFSLTIRALGPRFTVGATHAATVAGSVVVGAGVALGRGTFLSIVYGMLYVWVAQSSAVFFRPAQARAHVVFATAVHAAALSTLPPGPRAATWLLTAGTCHVVLVFHRMATRHSARLEGLVEHSGAAVVIARPDGTICDVGGPIERLLGEGAALVGTSIVDLVHGEDRLDALQALAQAVHRSGGASFEARLRRAEGGWVQVEASLNNALADPSIGGIVLALRDVSDRKRLQDQLSHQANHDVVTGLPNRRQFAERVRQTLTSPRSGIATVLFVDLDHFKDVNDALGHAAGDRLLEAVSGRVATALSGGDTVARLGGDEFGVLLEAVGGASEAAGVADRILDALQSPFTVAGNEVFVTASIGIAAAAVGGPTTVGELLRDADLAMNMAKDEGRSRACLFQPAMHAHLLDRVELEGDLRRAVARGELVLHYQPLVDIGTARVVGVEALLRWNHPTRGMVPPLQFIPLAEESDLIVRLGRWVLDAACREGQQLVAASSADKPLHVSVNLSARQLGDPDLVGFVGRALARSGLPPDRLVLEITETVVAGNLEATQQTLEALRSLGVRIAIDDFGSGYSSLKYLKTLPVDILKIDRAFVKGLGRTARDGALADAIVTLGHSLGLATVAEGIESEAQLDRLHRAGCDIGQGFFFASPMPLIELCRFLGRPEAVVS